MPPPAGGPAGYTPPEGGWGWAVVVGAFISIGFSYAFPKSITVFFKDIEVIFDATPSQVSWISSIMLAVMYAGGKCPQKAGPRSDPQNGLWTLERMGRSAKRQNRSQMLKRLWGFGFLFSSPL